MQDFDTRWKSEKAQKVNYRSETETLQSLVSVYNFMFCSFFQKRPFSMAAAKPDKTGRHCKTIPTMGWRELLLQETERNDMFRM